MAERSLAGREGDAPICAETPLLSAKVLAGFCRAVNVVTEATSEIERAARAAAELWEAGGQLVYVGAGASGLIAAQDAAELPGTFGLECSRIKILLAGGVERPAAIVATTRFSISAFETPARTHLVRSR